MRERKLSVNALSETTGISGRLIRRYRAGDSEPRDYFGDPTENGIKLALALSLSVEDLLPSPEDVAA